MRKFSDRDTLHRQTIFAGDGFYEVRYLLEEEGQSKSGLRY